MGNQFDLEDELGWCAAVDLASRLGWRDGSKFFDKMTGAELNRAMHVTTKLLNQTRGHINDLRNVYGAAYAAAYRVADRQLRQTEKKYVKLNEKMADDKLEIFTGAWQA